MFLNDYHYILLSYTLALLHQYHIIYLRIVYSAYAINKWNIIFKYYLFINIICCCTLSRSASNSYSSIKIYIYIHHYNHINLTLTLNFFCSSWFIIYFDPIFVLNLVGWFGVLSERFIIFWYSIYYTIALILDHQ